MDHSDHAEHVAEERRFVSIEQLVGALEADFQQHVPLPQHGGIASVFAVKRWNDTYCPGLETARRALVIPPDPSVFLTFPTLSQEFAIARSDADPDVSALSLEQIGEDFGLNEIHLTQPVFSLSGGERVRGALAKASLLLPKADTLVLCAPTHWLHLESFRYLEKLQQRAANLGVRTIYLLLEGDSLAAKPEPAVPAENKPPPKEVTWFLESKDFELALDTGALNAHLERILQFRAGALNNVPFRSPTTMTGKNGAGKSLFAKSITGIKAHARAFPKSKTGPAHGRLVVQESLSHLFRHKISQHPARVFDFDQNGKKTAEAIFNGMSDKCRAALWRGNPDDPYLVGAEADPDTLLQAKLMLVAERLSAAPSLLVLDEPAWGLSLPQAQALVKVTVEECHARDIPVLVIAHAPQRLKMQQGSWIDVQRTGNDISFETGDRP